jgi:hypothetical protein
MRDYNLSHFEMYIHVPHLSTAIRIHTFTTLAPQALSPIALPATPMVGSWTPLAMATGSRTPPQYQVLLCDAVMMPMTLPVPPKTELGIELHLGVRSPNHLDAWRSNSAMSTVVDIYSCRTTFYAFNVQVGYHEKEVEYDQVAQQLKTIPLGSTFFASKVYGLRPTKVQDVKLWRGSGPDASLPSTMYHINDLTAVQVISRHTSAGRYHGVLPARADNKDSMVAIVWRFRLAESGRMGVTTWRKVEVEGMKMDQGGWFGSKVGSGADYSEDEDGDDDLMDVDVTESAGMVLSTETAGDMDPFKSLDTIYSGSHSFPSYLSHSYATDLLSLPTGLTEQFPDISQEIMDYSQTSFRSFGSTDLGIHPQTHGDAPFGMPMPQSSTKIGLSLEALHSHSTLDVESSVGVNTSASLFDDASHLANQWHSSSTYIAGFYNDPLSNLNIPRQLSIQQLTAQDHLNETQHLSQDHEILSLEEHQAHLSADNPLHAISQHLSASLDPTHHLLCTTSPPPVFAPTATAGGNVVAALEDTAEKYEQAFHPLHEKDTEGGTGGSFGIPGFDSRYNSPTDLPACVSEALHDGSQVQEVPLDSPNEYQHQNPPGIYTPNARNDSQQPPISSPDALGEKRTSSSPMSPAPPVRLELLGAETFVGLEAAEALQRALGLRGESVGETRENGDDEVD